MTKTFRASLHGVNNLALDTVGFPVCGPYQRVRS